MLVLWRELLYNGVVSGNFPLWPSAIVSSKQRIRRVRATRERGEFGGWQGELGDGGQREVGVPSHSPKACSDAANGDSRLCFSCAH